MTRRQEKVESLLQQTAAQVMNREFSLPHTTATVTKADVSPDMRNVIVWISVYGDKRDELVGRVEAAAPGAIASALAQIGSLRGIPRIHVKIDESGEDVERIARLLNSVKGD